MIRGQTNRLRSQTRPRLNDPRLFALALIVACALFLSLSTHLATSAAAIQSPPPQRPRPQRRAPARPPTQRRSPDYWTKFSHARKEHNDRSCAWCHVTYTKPAMTFERPETETFPDHPACIECHRTEFFRGPFRGTAPAICADCHVAASPSKAARFEFPHPQRPYQFDDVFPHGSHQTELAEAQFKKVKIEKPKQGEAFSCLYCHQLDPPKKEAPAKGQPPESVPNVGTYYDTYTDHANCFQCHWSQAKSGAQQKVYKDDCSKCHGMIARPMQAQPPAVKGQRAGATLLPGIATVVAAHAVAPEVNDWPPRVSPKFEHESSSHQATDEAGCVKCHEGLSKDKNLSLAQLRQRENQVQLASCADCHNKLSGSGDNAKLFNELKEHFQFYQQPKEKRPAEPYNCTYCHAPDLGTKPEVPCSHYRVFLPKSKKLPPGVLRVIPEGKCKEELTKGAE